MSWLHNHKSYDPTVSLSTYVRSLPGIHPTMPWTLPELPAVGWYTTWRNSRHTSLLPLNTHPCMHWRGRRCATCRMSASNQVGHWYTNHQQLNNKKLRIASFHGSCDLPFWWMVKSIILCIRLWVNVSVHRVPLQHGDNTLFNVASYVQISQESVV